MLSKLWGNSSLSFRLPDSNDRHYSLEMGIRLLVLIAFSTYYGEWQCQALLVAPLGLDAEFSDNLCVVVQLLSLVHFFAIPWTAARQVSLSFILSQSLLKLMSIESIMPSNHPSSVIPFSCPQSFPTSGCFPASQLFASGGQSTGVSTSASVLTANIQG